MTPRRAHVVLALLVGGGVVAAAASLSWVRVTGLQDGDALLLVMVDTEATGAEVAPLTTASALVTLAAAGTLALSGRVARVVALAVAVAAGAAATASTLAFVLSPGGPAAAAVTETGGRADGAVTALTPWPWVALAGSVVVLAVAAVGIVKARQWDAVTRFEAPSVRSAEGDGSTPGPSAAREPGPGDDWDALSRDEDPTEEPTEEAENRRTGRSPGGALPPSS